MTPEQREIIRTAIIGSCDNMEDERALLTAFDGVLSRLGNAVELRPRDGGWQADYGEHHAIGPTREDALVRLGHYLATLDRAGEGQESFDYGPGRSNCAECSATAYDHDHGGHFAQCSRYVPPS